MSGMRQFQTYATWPVLPTGDGRPGCSVGGVGVCCALVRKVGAGDEHAAGTISDGPADRGVIATTTAALFALDFPNDSRGLSGEFSRARPPKVSIRRVRLGIHFTRRTQLKRAVVASGPEHNRGLGIRGNLIAGGLVAGGAGIGIKLLGPHFLPNIDPTDWNIIAPMLGAVTALLTYPLGWAWRKVNCEFRRRRAASAPAPHEADTFIMPVAVTMQMPTRRLPDYAPRHRDI
jgi:hypothetical protein